MLSLTYSILAVEQWCSIGWLTTAFRTHQITGRSLMLKYRRTFVYTEYAGYLRRDADIAGFLFWLDKVNQFPVRDPGIQHTMACAFITSAEYQQRFSSVVTRSNQECGQ